jgi:hypothetical protein
VLGQEEEEREEREEVRGGARRCEEGAECIRGSTKRLAVRRYRDLNRWRSRLLGAKGVGQMMDGYMGAGLEYSMQQYANRCCLMLE